jgi:hypothetical protein
MKHIPATFLRFSQLFTLVLGLAVPTLVRKLPEPVRKIIGDLSNKERVLVGLDLRLRET